VTEFLEQFLIEGRELVQQTTEDLLALEEAPQDQAPLDSVFRGFHTLKGLAGIVEFPAMSRVLHAAEGSLSAVRSGNQAITAEAITDYLACLDQVSQWLDELEREDRLPEVQDSTANALAALFEESSPDISPAAMAAPATAQPNWIEPLLAVHPEQRGAARVAVRYRPDRDCFFRAEDPLALIAALPGLLTLELTPNEPWPSLDALDPFACNLSMTALSSGTFDDVTECLRSATGQFDIHALAPARPVTGRPALSPEALAVLEDQLLLAREETGQGFAGRLGSAGQVSVNVLRHAGWADAAEALRHVLAEGLRMGQAAPFAECLQKLISEPLPASDTEIDGPSLPRSDEIAVRALRVEVERIDAMVRLVGELTVLKNSLGHATRLARDGINTVALGALLTEQHVRLDRLVQELQRSLLGIRILPMRYVFRRFPRLVREMAGELGKSIRLVIEGEATEADKAVVEGLSEPLLHVLRNAVGHGVETAEKRAAAGKSPTATIWLRAARMGERIIVEVEDDGAGIDTAKVRAVAAARGIAVPEAIAAMSEEEISRLIFAPGLSTAASVSEVSGRGVGMDAVRSAVERFGGHVEVASRPDGGTRVRFEMPIAVIMSRVLTLEAGSQIFGVPLENVVETARLAREQIIRIGATQAVVLRDRTIPVVNLANALGLPGAGAQAGQANVVITSTAGQLAGLQVDRFGEQLDVMLRPMDGLLAGLRGIAGTTLLGDGRVLIVLDMEELLQ
jgi:two-component system, chemotaxis family, sensor kinase CheA